MNNIDYTSDASHDSDNLSSRDVEFIEVILLLALEFINHTPHNFLNKLLLALRKYTTASFPEDVRTLLKTSRQINVKEMDDGQYCHDGLRDNIDIFLNKYIINYPEKDTIEIFGMIDGFPTSHSSEKSAWIILISDTIFNDVAAVGAQKG